MTAAHTCALPTFPRFPLVNGGPLLCFTSTSCLFFQSFLFLLKVDSAGRCGCLVRSLFLPTLAKLILWDVSPLISVGGARSSLLMGGR